MLGIRSRIYVRQRLLRNIEELDTALQKMASNKSPGTDGLMANVYKLFWKDLRNLLFESLKECLEKKELMPSMKQVLNTLIP